MISGMCESRVQCVLLRSLSLLVALTLNQVLVVRICRCRTTMDERIPCGSGTSRNRLAPSLLSCSSLALKLVCGSCQVAPIYVSNHAGRHAPIVVRCGNVSLRHAVHLQIMNAFILGLLPCQYPYIRDAAVSLSVRHGRQT